MSAENVSPMSLPPGSQVGAYTIDRLVGHGGFGYLYRVVRDRRMYALKISKKRPADMDEDLRGDWLARLDREVAALKSMNHPNIVRVHSFDWHPSLDEGYPYLVMDLVEGVQLDEWRKKAAPSVRQVVELTVSLARAIGYFHAAGIVHRDLKPANIFVRDEDGEPVVLDFGIARVEIGEPVTAAGWSIGTISYFAPEYAGFLLSRECAEGAPFTWTTATDIHALGFIFYELLTGRPPFPVPKTDGGDTSVYQTIKSFVPTLPSVRTEGALPEVLDDVVMRLLAKDPAARGSAVQLADDLEQMLGEAGQDWDAPTPIPAPVRVGPPRGVARTKAGAATGAGRGETPAPAPLAQGAQSIAEPGRPAARFAAIPAGPSASAAAMLDAAAAEGREAPRVAVFRPPTEVRPRMSGVGPAASVGAPAAAQEPSPAVMATEVRRKLEQLEPERSGPSMATKVVLGGAAFLVMLFVALYVAAQQQPAQPRQQDLLKAVERQKAEEAARGDKVATPPAVVEPATKSLSLADAAAGEKPAQTAPVAVPDPAPASAPSAKPARTPEEEIAEIERTRLGGRPPASTPPRKTGGGVPRAAAPTEGPQDGNVIQRSSSLGGVKGDASGFQRSVSLAPASRAAAKTGLGVPLGAHIKVRLLSNLDSRTLGQAPVEALVISPYYVQDVPVLQARTVLYGTASTTGARFVIQFHRLRLPDNSEVALEAVAMDVGDGKPGLRATRSIAPERSEGPGLGSRIASHAAGSAVMAVPLGGGVATSIGKQAAGEAIGGASEASPERGGESAIMLDAPVLFDLFVTKAF